MSANYWRINEEETKKREHLPEEESGVNFWKVMCIKHTSQTGHWQTSYVVNLTGTIFFVGVFIYMFISRFHENQMKISVTGTLKAPPSDTNKRHRTAIAL
jgi:hypothetical protein